MDYSFKHGLYKALKYVVIFILPALVDKFIISYPEISGITPKLFKGSGRSKNIKVKNQ